MSNIEEKSKVIINEPEKKISQSQEIPSRVKYKITPEEMWNCIKGTSQNWGIEGYEITKKYFDYRQALWYKKREKILNAHKREWPPQDWPKNKETDKLVPPKRRNFIDDQIAWANSFNDPQKSEELKENLQSRGTYKYPDPKQYPNLRDKFLKNEKEKKEKFEQLPKIQFWKENGIEQAKQNIEEAKSKVKSQWQKNLERYPKEKPWWPRADRVTIISEAEHVGEQIPFYYTNKKDDNNDDKNKKIFYPNKEYVLKRSPAWSFIGKNPTKLPTENMVQKENLISEKLENFKSSKNITDKDLQIDVMASHDKIRKRGRYYFQYRKPYDYANTEQYKLNKEQHPSFSPDPTHYWKMKDIDKNERPKDLVNETEVNGKPTKIYYMNRKRTDFRQYKPMRKSVF